MKYLKIILCFVCLATPVYAQEQAPDEFDAVPPPPDIPDPLQSGQPIEPEVTIIRKQDSTVEEYRVNGNLYMIKVIPAVGKPYYLVDNDGDGQMESRINRLGSETVVPKWVLFSWD